LFARQWFSGAQLSDIESAVGEALANCAEHGYAHETFIEVRCQYDRGQLCIEITDSGTGFERWQSRDFSKPQASAPRGYGTYIMHRLMDEIEYTERGTRIRLVKLASDAAYASAEERTEQLG